MAHLSFALLEAFERGASIDQIAARLGLPPAWVAERVEAARLCLRVPPMDVEAFTLDGLSPAA